MVNPSGSAGQVALVDTDGKNFKALDVKASPGALAWSPDGKSLAFVDAQFGVTIVDADGSNPQTIKNSGAAGGSFAWTPDSKQITIVSELTVTNLDLATNTSQSILN